MTKKTLSEMLCGIGFLVAGIGLGIRFGDVAPHADATLLAIGLTGVVASTLFGARDEPARSIDAMAMVRNVSALRAEPGDLVVVEFERTADLRPEQAKQVATSLRALLPDGVQCAVMHGAVIRLEKGAAS